MCATAEKEVIAAWAARGRALDPRSSSTHTPSTSASAGLRHRHATTWQALRAGGRFAGNRRPCQPPDRVEAGSAGTSGSVLGPPETKTCESFPPQAGLRSRHVLLPNLDHLLLRRQARSAAGQRCRRPGGAPDARSRVRCRTGDPRAPGTGGRPTHAPGFCVRTRALPRQLRLRGRRTPHRQPSRRDKDRGDLSRGTQPG